MGYFSTFLVFHLCFRHRFSSSGSPFLDQAWRIFVYVAVSAWGWSVAYSRYVRGIRKRMHACVSLSVCLSIRLRTETLLGIYRYHLQYHTPHQIFWGYGIGVVCGALAYLFSELIPRYHPNSILGKFKTFLVSNPVSTWLQIRDGWAVWEDGGREDEWKRWRTNWEKQKLQSVPADEKRSQ